MVAGRAPVSAVALDAEQRSVIEASPDDWLLVVAGPGTGKTQVASMRLVHLLRTGFYPSQILVLSFSRSAVATLTRRIKRLDLKDEALLEELRHLSIRTFDSWAFRMLRQSGSLPAELLRRTHDDNISEVSERLADPADDALASRLENVRHVIVDEFQDLPGVRARMVTELLSRLNDSGKAKIGFTVLGDPAQAIFRFADRARDGAPSTDPWEDLKKRMGTGLTEIRLEKNYRSTDQLATLAASMRKILRSNLLDPASKLKAMRVLLDRLPLSPTGERIDSKWMTSLPRGSVAILTRTNGEAMRVATMLLGQTEGLPAIHFRLKLSGEGVHAPAWISALFSHYKLPTIARTVFAMLHARAEANLDVSVRAVIAIPGFEQAWRMLAHAAGQPDTAASIDMESIRQRLEWPDSFPDDENQVTAQILVTTIHQAKGMEFDNVELLESRPRKDDDSPADPLEEANIGFVAITRAGLQIRRLPAECIYRPLNDTPFPHGRSRQVGWGKMLNLQMGLRGDIDATSFVDEEILGTEAKVSEVQQTLLRQTSALRGYKVALRRVTAVPESGRHRDARYELVLQGGELHGLVLGRTAWQLTEDLLNVLWSRGYGLPNNIYNLRIGEVVTLTSTRDEHRAIPDPWRSSLIWLGVTLFGTGDFKLWKRKGQ
ncbi:UvrD-helicase domain-containing protein [Acidovorax sp.]|uniref:UvrD-helicase domain-containing protein n=1 Tax=Acidovorax sp. TaxID=1872122 RepID=UPI002ACE0029|nr:UvrD-helicase domain-containing protein [Acidovorax sp.]MDZ7867244.1 UvrD-helicase domain-containing protein [Acidovorax sp.]